MHLFFIQTSRRKLGPLVSGRPSSWPPFKSTLCTYTASFQHNHFVNMSNREDSIRLAIADLESGVFTSQRKAAAKYNIPRSTLASRLTGSSAARVGH
ncbi:hypothetical protein K432DRAFT_314010 [Lepidopterella palustris CBS 459.81]|uniref:HTH psq-type domain-containing protein n=1 Tax=Lepidopterella palustris CBS 459.81 TaxID=1314670 RepID=A0A8E2DWI0_9PEZI|nr:hypothetical protein K432DRAFT_314010 [Lepidopterella palustris CBS 459.81]